MCAASSWSPRSTRWRPAPLIDTRTGGTAGGGAALTPLGLQVVEAYAAVEAAVEAAADAPLKRLAGLLS